MNRYDEDARFLPALQGEIIADDSHALSQAEALALAGGQQFAGLAMAGRSGLSRAQQTDTAITHAQAHLLAAAPSVAALAMVTSGLVLLGFLVAGGPVAVWIGVELAVLGAAAFATLSRQRRTGLEFTPAGVERRDIDKRAEVAMFVVDRHCEMVERIKGVRK